MHRYTAKKTNPKSKKKKKKKKSCALPGNRTQVARMGILHDTTTLAVLTHTSQQRNLSKSVSTNEDKTRSLCILTTSMSSCDLMYFLEVGLLRRKERVRVTDSLILGVWGGGRREEGTEGGRDEGRDRGRDGGREGMVKHGYQYTTTYTQTWHFSSPRRRALIAPVLAASSVFRRATPDTTPKQDMSMSCQDEHTDSVQRYSTKRC